MYSHFETVITIERFSLLRFFVSIPTVWCLLIFKACTLNYPSQKTQLHFIDMNGSGNLFSTKFTFNIKLLILVHLISLETVIIDSSKLQLLYLENIMMMNETNYHISLILLWQFLFSLSWPQDFSTGNNFLILTSWAVKSSH